MKAVLMSWICYFEMIIFNINDYNTLYLIQKIDSDKQKEFVNQHNNY